ncbi:MULTISPECIES: hypothetical protein [Mesorhizobium]|uniref:Uncharacterized protein n=1 Tax=Mesorhizobium abyssinicae TaxID=1209958 RepID=A0ABU5AWS5_9HYPH|nr:MULTISPECIES: hypothetical protein [Mesorhizobium]MDX8541785.1 hypothetical protein [Mesorhizobium abyssinicae]
MDVRNLIGRLSSTLLRQRAAASPAAFRPSRDALADVPLKPRPRPPFRPQPPIRPASNM